jgi:integrase
LLLAQGVHPRLVMEILGHSQIAVTMNTYSHVIPAMKAAVASRMDEILNPVATQVATHKETDKPN